MKISNARKFNLFARKEKKIKRSSGHTFVVLSLFIQPTKAMKPSIRYLNGFIARNCCIFNMCSVEICRVIC